MQAVMTGQAGVLRSAAGLAGAVHELAVLARRPGLVGTAAWETTNLVTISGALAAAARLREETRGSHWREDFPERDDAHFAGHLDVSMAAGAVSVRFRPSPATDREPGA